MKDILQTAKHLFCKFLVFACASDSSSCNSTQENPLLETKDTAVITSTMTSNFKRALFGITIFNNNMWIAGGTPPQPYFYRTKETNTWQTYRLTDHMAKRDANCLIKFR